MGAQEGAFFIFFLSPFPPPMSLLFKPSKAILMQSSLCPYPSLPRPTHTHPHTSPPLWDSWGPPSKCKRAFERAWAVLWCAAMMTHVSISPLLSWLGFTT